jgi:integration host factor subunit alpha
VEELASQHNGGGYMMAEAPRGQGVNETMATLTKVGLTEAVCTSATGFSKREAAEVVEAFFNTIKETLERGESIKVAGFGNFVVRDKKARIGRNPQSGEAIEISARRVVTFKASDLLKKKLSQAVPEDGSDAAESDDRP